MAINDDLASLQSKIKVGDADSNRPVSSAVMSKYGRNINYLLDNTFNEIVFEYKGYIPTNPSSVFITSLAPIYLPPLTLPDAHVINYYSLSFGSIGDTGTPCRINFSRFTDTGASLGKMFTGGSGPSMQATVANQSNPSIWYDFRESPATTGSVNVSNITTGIPGFLNSTYPGGYYLKFEIESMATKVLNLRFVMRFI